MYSICLYTFIHTRSLECQCLSSCWSVAVSLHVFFVNLLSFQVDPAQLFTFSCIHHSSILVNWCGLCWFGLWILNCRLWILDCRLWIADLLSIQVITGHLWAPPPHPLNWIVDHRLRIFRQIKWLDFILVNCGLLLLRWIVNSGGFWSIAASSSSSVEFHSHTWLAPPPWLWKLIICCTVSVISVHHYIALLDKVHIEL